MKAEIVPGAAFPDYELSDHRGKRRKLSELQGPDPLVLVLSRGGFCPKDHQQHLELAANYPKIRVAYTQIVTISTDNVLKTNEFRDSAGGPKLVTVDLTGRNEQQIPTSNFASDPAWSPLLE